MGHVNEVGLSTGKASTIGGGRLSLPEGIAISPNGDTSFVADGISYLAVFDALTGKLTKTVELAGSLTTARTASGG